jgi:hypothetical protein
MSEKGLNSLDQTVVCLAGPILKICQRRGGGGGGGSLVSLKTYYRTEKSMSSHFPQFVYDDTVHESSDDIGRYISENACLM